MNVDYLADKLGTHPLFQGHHSLQEPLWLKEIRRKAFTHAQQRLLKRDLTPAEEASCASLCEAGVLNFAASEAAQDALARQAFAELQKTLRAEGVFIGSIHEALGAGHDQTIARHFNQSAFFNGQEDFFTLLNLAAWMQGNFIHVPHGRKVSLPIEPPLNSKGKSRFALERTLIILEEGSSLTYMEGCSSHPQGVLQARLHVSEVFVARAAHYSGLGFMKWHPLTKEGSRRYFILEEKAAAEMVHTHINPATRLDRTFIKGAQDSSFTSEEFTLLTSGQENEVRKPCLAASHQGGVRVTHKALAIVKNGSVLVPGDDFARPSSPELAMKIKVLPIDPASTERQRQVWQEWEQKFPLARQCREGVFELISLSEAQLAYLVARGFSPDEARSMLCEAAADEFSRSLPLEYAVELARFLTK
jgi:Fe-S cluster assembly protein SufB